MRLVFKEEIYTAWKYMPRVRFILKRKSFGVKWKYRGYWYGFLFWDLNKEKEDI